MGNLLDNAIEACLRMGDSPEKKFISFSLFAKGKFMEITVSNSFNGTILKRGNRYLTSKDKRINGIGLDYIDSIVAKYQGHIYRGRRQTPCPVIKLF